MRNDPARALFKHWLRTLQYAVPKGDCMALGDPRVGIQSEFNDNLGRVDRIHFGRVGRAPEWGSSNLASAGERYLSVNHKGHFKLYWMSSRGFGNALNKRKFVEDQVPFLYYGWHTREMCWAPKMPDDDSLTSSFENHPGLAYVSEKVLGNHGWYHRQTPWFRLIEADGRLEFKIAPGQRLNGNPNGLYTTWQQSAWDNFPAMRVARERRAADRDRERQARRGHSFMPTLTDGTNELGHVESFYRLAALMSVSEPARTIAPLKRPKEARNDHMVTSH